MLGLALAAVVAGAIIAFASNGGHDHKHAKRSHASGHRTNRHHASHHRQIRGESQLAADYLGLSRAELRAHLKSGESMGQVAQTMPGKSASGLIEALLAPRVNQVRALKLPPRKERSRLQMLRTEIAGVVSEQRARRGDIPTAADYLGLSESTLRTRLRAGATLAQIANSTKGHSSAVLVAKILSVKAARLRAALTARSITAAQEKSALAAMQKRVAHEVGHKPPQAR